MSTPSYHILDLNLDSKAFQSSLLTLRSLTMQNNICRSKIMYDKKKLGFRFSSKCEIVLHDKYTQLKYNLTPREEYNLLSFEKKLTKLMSSKLCDNEVIKSVSEAYDNFQSNILNDHETNVFVCKFSNSHMESVDCHNTVVLPTSIRFQTGKSMSVEFVPGHKEEKEKEKEKEKEMDGMCKLQDDKGIYGEENENENENENGIEERKEKEDQNENENENEKTAFESSVEEKATDVQNDEEVFKDTDINEEYMEVVRVARKALVDLKTKEDTIKRALAKYINCAGSYLPRSNTNTLSQKQKLKYTTNRDNLYSLFSP